MDMIDIINKDRKEPKIIIVDKELLKDICCWLGTHVNVKKRFGELLINVGFKNTDEVVLYKYSNHDDYLSFNYIVNGKNPYKKNVIMLEYENEFNNKPRIMVATGSKNTRSRIVYEVDRTSSNKIGNNYHVFSYWYEDKRGWMLSRRYYENKAEFFIEKGDYELCLAIKESMGSFLKRNNDSVYQIKNEKELIKYLTSLTFPLEIDSVYKKICELSLGDISMYPSFSLRVNKYDVLDGLEEVTDMIELENGKLSLFGMTRNGKTIILDGDGNWTYEKELSDMTSIIQYEDDEYSYCSICDGGLANEDKHKDMDKVEMRDIAIKDIEETKRLVRSIINK